jgi:hypothetical protein
MCHEINEEPSADPHPFNPYEITFNKVFLHSGQKPYECNVYRKALSMNDGTEKNLRSKW